MLTLNMARQHRRQSERSPSQRQLRVGELIRHALADMLTRGEVHDPVLEGHIDHRPGSAHVARTCGLRPST